MLHSLTDLLLHIQTDFEEPFVLKSPVYETTAHRRSVELQLKRTSALRFACVQGYFFRLSWQEKRSLLYDFAEQIDTMRALNLLVGTLADDLHGKLYSHSRAIVTTNFAYDQIYHDDNRSLDVKVSKKVRKESVTWFKELPDTQQVSMFIGLVRLAAGAMVPVALAFVTDRRKRVLQKEMKQPIPEPPPPHQSDSHTHVHTNMSPRESLTLLHPEKMSKGDPNDPEFAKVLKMRKSWDDMVAKYKVEVDGKKANKGKKVNKAQKSKGKSEVSAKKGKVRYEEEIDMIQLLPIWIVKQIFSYLDKKTLQKITKVNSYWNFAAKDVLKEMDMRKTMKKTIKHLEDELLLNGGYSSAIYPSYPTFPRKTTSAKRMSNLQTIGCTSKKLRKPIKHEFFTSLLSEAPRDMADEYILPVDQVIPFPRNCMPELKVTDTRDMLFLDTGLYVSLKKKGTQTEIAGGIPKAPDEEDFCEIETESDHFKTPGISANLPEGSVCDMFVREHDHTE